MVSDSSRLTADSTGDPEDWVSGKAEFIETEMGVLPGISKAVQEVDWIFLTDIQGEAVPIPETDSNAQGPVALRRPLLLTSR
ncbi:unnamed protein product [Hymenolepis diminuta]|uniref:Uncharacterized protein n=1 Tax=Hymenolepis diminuta TaxID=6216 RepID=A0A564XYD4_HYMDI|nr:unnamed protein product [Hymenolepis diminuta]